MFLKPLVFFLALPLILLTFGIAYFFVNTVMLLFTEWVTPDFSIDGFWTYVGATIIVWAVNYLLGSVFGFKHWDERFASGLSLTRATGSARANPFHALFLKASASRPLGRDFRTSSTSSAPPETRSPAATRTLRTRPARGA